MEEKISVQEAIRRVMEEITPVAKTRINEGQGYQYRGIDDLYNVINRLHAKHGIVTIPMVVEYKCERFQVRERMVSFIHLEVEYAIVGPDGSKFVAKIPADGIDSSDKGVYKALSGAHKYLLFQLYCVPTGEAMDAERDHIEVPAEQVQKDPISEDVPDDIIDKAIMALRKAKDIKELEDAFYTYMKQIPKSPKKVAVFKEFEEMKKKFSGGKDEPDIF